MPDKLNLQPVEQKLDLEPLDLEPIEPEGSKKKESTITESTPLPLVLGGGTSGSEPGSSDLPSPLISQPQTKKLDVAKENIKKTFLNTDSKTYDNPKYRNTFYEAMNKFGTFTPSEAQHLKEYGEKVAIAKNELLKSDKEANDYQNELKFIDKVKKIRPEESDDYKALNQREKELKSNFRKIGMDTGISQLKMGDTDAAIATLEGALSDEYKPTKETQETKKTDADIYFNLADAYQKKGDIKRAIDYYLKAGEGELFNPESYKALSRIYLKQGRKDLASASMEVVDKIEQANSPEKSFDWLNLANNDWNDVLNKIVAFPEKFATGTIDQVSKGIDKILEYSSGSKGSAMNGLGGMLAGATDVAFGAFNVTPPGVVFGVSNEVLPEKLLDPIFAPVSTIAGIDENSSETKKNWAKVFDVVAIMAGGKAIHGKEKPNLSPETKEAVDKFTNNEPINEQEFNSVKSFVEENKDLIQPAAEEVAKKVMEETPSPKLPDNILELKEEHARAVTDLEQMPDGKIKEVAQKAVADLGEKIDAEETKIAENTHNDAHKLAETERITDEINSLKESLPRIKSENVRKSIEAEIQSLEKEVDNLTIKPIENENKIEETKIQGENNNQQGVGELPASEAKEEIGQSNDAHIYTEQEIREAFKMRDEELNSLPQNEYKTQFIHDNLPRIRKDDFIRYGDASNYKGREGALNLKHFSKKALPLDVITQELSEKSGLEIKPQDVIDYIIDRETIPEKYINNKVKEISEAAELIPEDTATIINDWAKNGFDFNNIDAVEKARGFPLSDLDADTIIEYLKAQKNEKEKPNTGATEGPEKSSKGTGKSQGVEGIAKGSETGREINSIQDAQLLYAQRKISLGELHKELERLRKTVQQDAPAKTFEMASGNSSGRIPVAPIEGVRPKQIKDIVLDVTKGTKQRLLYAKTGRAGGNYSPGNSAIKIKYNGDLDVTAHEVGHSMDDLFGVLTNAPESLDGELSKFWDYGSKPKAGMTPQEALNYKRGEGFAEWLRAYMANPEEAKLQAPELHKLYEEKVSPEYKKTLEDFSNDIRSFSGATGRDMTLANIEFEPKKADGIIKEIFSKKDNGNEFVITYGDKLKANFIDPLNAFNKAFEYAKGIKGLDEVLPENDPQILSRLLLGIDGKYGEILEQGMIDSENKLLKDANGNNKNLNWLLEPLNNLDPETIKEEMKDVISYMVAERTIELANRFDRENILTGIGGGLFKDADIASKTLDEFAKGDPNKLARIHEASERYREFADDILRYMVDKGRMSEESYKEIKDNNIQYVGLQRIMETEPGREIEPAFGGSNKLGSKGEPINKIQGSSKEIINPYISLINTLYKSIKEADRNDVLRSFRDVISEDRGMREGEVKKFSDIGVIGKEGDKNAIPIFIDGKPEHWIFQEDIYKALKGLDAEAYKLPGVITALPRALRWTVTNFPTFAARNIVRDTQDRLIKSEDGSGFKDFVGDKKHWNEVAANGGLNAGYYFKDRASYYGLLDKAMTDLAKDKKTIVLDPSKIKDLGRAYQNMLQKSETLNRVAEYRAAFKKGKAKGMDDYNASLYGAYKARDLMDFQLMGNYMKIINQLIPFSNASVQGLRKTISSAKQNPKGFAGRLFLYSAVPTTALWLLNHKDEETAKEYEALPAYQRDMAWNFKIGDNKWVSIPKPYELSLPGAAIDRGLSQGSGYDNSFNGYAGSVSKSLLPLDQGNIAGPGQGIIEGITNYDFFRDKYIVPPHENAIDLSLRNNERASRLGKLLQNVAGADARKIDHFIKSQFSYFGGAATKLSNIGRENGEHFGLTDLGFFKETPAYNSQPVQDFMKYAEKWDLARNPRYKEFGRLAKDYFNAKEDKEKEQLGDVLVEYAKNVLSEWEKISMKKGVKVKSENSVPSTPIMGSKMNVTPIKSTKIN